MSLACRRTSIFLLAVALLDVPAGAQLAAGPGLERVAALRPADPPGRRTVVAPATTYQTEGAIIGGLALGLPTFLLIAELCGMSTCSGPEYLSSLLIGAIGAFIGAVIGGVIEREPGTPGVEAP
ncbi:MAG TPA: hypothetical protein VJ773_00510 [Gemmatimonadales bacterium]|nr:hypothetical protein [Gemmatimonadales bacterium]